jgi:hypothetical protein
MSVCKPCDGERRETYRKSGKSGGSAPRRTADRARAVSAPLGERVRDTPSAPKVIPSRALGPLRTLTEHEHITLLARNIGTLANELQDIADIAAQDRRTLNPDSVFTSNTFDIRLQALEHELTILVEGVAQRLGLVAIE